MQQALDNGISSQLLPQRLTRLGIGLVAIWVIGLVLLFGAGILLSRLTLAAVDRTSATSSASRSERLVERFTGA